jgi:NADPH-dependent curcumin reductase CurA
VGDKVVGMGGWQEYSVVDADQPGALRKVDTTHVPLSHYLGAVGMPGVTAWYGLVKIIAPKPGQTVVVSAATGAVGSAFGALAKARGLPRGGHRRRPGQVQVRHRRAGL